jgi:hypothetical protein
MFKISAAGKRYLANPKSTGLVWKGSVRINLALATQEQLELLWDNGKSDLVEKEVAKTPPPPQPIPKAPEPDKEAFKKPSKD